MVEPHGVRGASQILGMQILGMQILGMQVLVAVILAGSAVWACCMVPTRYPGDVDQTRQDVVIVHHADVEQLLIRVNPYFPDLEYGPTHLAWLLTIPAPPTGYEAVDAAVFLEAQRLYQKLESLARDQEPESLMPTIAMKASVDSARSAGPSGGIDIRREIKVGPYEITEIGARGPEAAEALNVYLTEREFPTESPEELRWFTERDFTFLAMLVRPETDQETLGTNIDLPALRIEFPTERLYYPAKYSARQGNFALGMTLVSSRPISRDSMNANREKLWSAGPRYRNLFTVKPLPGTLATAARHLPGAGDVGRWYVNPVISPRGFNRSRDGVPAIQTWNDDVFYALGGAADGPPSWYYGDGRMPLTQPFRTHPVATSLVVLLGAAILVLLVRRSRRKSD